MPRTARVVLPGYAHHIVQRGHNRQPVFAENRDYAYYLNGLREQGICLQRLALGNAKGHSMDRAREHYRKLLDTFPNDPETWALLGRVDKDAWTAAWRQPGKTAQEMRDEAAYEDALLRAAITSYAQGFRGNPGHYYSGINALTLMHLYQDLTADTRYDHDLKIFAGAVRFAAECEPDEQQRFWSLATLGDLEVLVGAPDTVKAAYKEAIAKTDKNWFALNSCRAQLLLLNELGFFRPEHVEAGIATFDRALQKLARPEDSWQPGKVILFSGHMIDAPGRTPPRFPADKESVAAQSIAEALKMLDVGPEDLALTQGACGGDLLFTEACLRLGVQVHWLQPFREADFIQKSVVQSDEVWRARYFEAKAKLAAPILSAPDELGEPLQQAENGYPYERCNLWLLYTALVYGVDKVRFICLWNGGGGDGPGGTAHMYQEVNDRTGQVTWLDTRKLW